MVRAISCRPMRLAWGIRISAQRLMLLRVAFLNVSTGRAIAAKKFRKRICRWGSLLSRSPPSASRNQRFARVVGSMR